ncbi:MAG: DUF4294 domain-containing protein [Bacteroidales bacterium]|nr:DUF4294 domain-containing protein [Bacteroidales bacterium]
MKHLQIILLLLLPLISLSAQDTIIHRKDTLPDRFYILHNVTRNGETLPEIELDEVTVTHSMSLKDRFQWWRYQRTVYNVKKVYPYCVLVRESLAEVNDTLETFSNDSDRRRFLRGFEKEIFSEYEDDMRSMTLTQGRILIKLIDRETMNSSYDLIRDYRGSVSALFWQGIARIFGSNLKAKYDPYGDDYLIERIILELEAGRI